MSSNDIMIIVEWLKKIDGNIERVHDRIGVCQTHHAERMSRLEGRMSVKNGEKKRDDESRDNESKEQDSFFLGRIKSYGSPAIILSIIIGTAVALVIVGLGIAKVKKDVGSQPDKKDAGIVQMR